MFEPIPENPTGLTQGSILLATGQGLVGGQHGETGQQFLMALGGDDDTIIALLGMVDDVLYGVALGKVAFRQSFQPSWTVQQLCDEISAGVWKTSPPSNPEHREELLSRLMAIANLPSAE